MASHSPIRNVTKLPRAEEEILLFLVCGEVVGYGIVWGLGIALTPSAISHPFHSIRPSLRTFFNQRSVLRMSWA